MDTVLFLGAVIAAGIGLFATRDKKPPLSDQDKVVPRDRDGDKRERSALESAAKTFEAEPSSQVKAATSIEASMAALVLKRGAVRAGIPSLPTVRTHAESRATSTSPAQESPAED